MGLPFVRGRFFVSFTEEANLFATTVWGKRTDAFKVRGGRNESIKAFLLFRQEMQYMQLEHGDNWNVTAYSQAWDAIHAAAPITAP